MYSGETEDEDENHDQGAAIIIHFCNYDIDIESKICTCYVYLSKVN